MKQPLTPNPDPWFIILHQDWSSGSYLTGIFIPSHKTPSAPFTYSAAMSWWWHCQMKYLEISYLNKWPSDPRCLVRPGLNLWERPYQYTNLIPHPTIQAVFLLLCKFHPSSMWLINSLTNVVLCLYWRSGFALDLRTSILLAWVLALHLHLKSTTGNPDTGNSVQILEATDDVRVHRKLLLVKR